MNVQRTRTGVLVGVVVCLLASPVIAQTQTGEIFGNVLDVSGAVLPGVTVTLDSPSLIQPQIVTTVSSGASRL